MTVESASFINDLNASNPADTDFAAEGAAHLRLIKAAIKATLPGATGVIGLPGTTLGNANVSLASTDNGKTLQLNAASGNLVATLPASAGITPGYTVHVIKADNSLNTVAFAAQGTDVIKGMGAGVLRYIWQMMGVRYVGSGTWKFIPYVCAGEVIDCFDLNLRPGFVYCVGTVGNSGSGGTQRANADVEQLYHVLWNSAADTECPVVGGRGASSVADWTANKAITLPDGRGRTTVGQSNPGGATAANIGNILDGTKIGKVAGEERHTQTGDELVNHGHTVNDFQHGHSISDFNIAPNVPTGTGTFPALVHLNSPRTVFTSVSSSNISINNSGGGNPMNVMQPSMVCSKQIRL